MTLWRAFAAADPFDPDARAGMMILEPRLREWRMGARGQRRSSMADLETVGGTPSHAWGKARAKGLDLLVRYMIFNWFLGALFGALCATALLAFDPFGIRPLMNDSGMGATAAFLLYVGFMTTFGGLVCAAAVMFPPKDDDPPRRGLRGNVTPQIAHARIPVRRSLAG